MQIRINEVIVNDVIYHRAFEFYFRDLVVVVVIWRRELLKNSRGVRVITGVRITSAFSKGRNSNGLLGQLCGVVNLK